MQVQELKALVGDGKFFSVEFIKRTDGQRRKMLARTGVKAGVSGDGAVYNPEYHNLLVVFDVQKKAYRCIPADNIIHLRCHGETHLGLAGRVQSGYQGNALAGHCSL